MKIRLRRVATFSNSDHLGYVQVGEREFELGDLEDVGFHLARGLLPYRVGSLTAVFQGASVVVSDRGHRASFHTVDEQARAAEPGQVLDLGERSVLERLDRVG